jgi:hypothetical protein
LVFQKGYTMNPTTPEHPYTARCDGAATPSRDAAAREFADICSDDAAGDAALTQAQRFALWCLEACGLCEPITRAVAVQGEWLDGGGLPFEWVLLASRVGPDDQARWVLEMMPFSRPMTRLCANPMGLLAMALDPTLTHQAIGWLALHRDARGRVQALVRSCDSLGQRFAFVIARDGLWIPVRSRTGALALLEREDWRDCGIEAEGVARVLRASGVKLTDRTRKLRLPNQRLLAAMADVSFIQAPAVSAVQVLLRELLGRESPEVRPFGSTLH